MKITESDFVIPAWRESFLKKGSPRQSGKAGIKTSFSLLAFISLLFALVFSCSVCFAGQSLISKDFSLVKDDYRNFYLNTTNLIELGAGIGGAAVFANTSMDRDIRDYYQDHFRSNTTDSLAKGAKVPGEIFITVPVLLGTHLLWNENTPLGAWAQMSLRAYAVGGPLGLVLQRVIGSGRPYETDSKWSPFKHDNGLSGHSFVGAVPFITGAKMFDNPFIKGFLYGLSALPALSRINDNKHYFSQAALGWYLAYLSCNTVQRTNEERERARFTVVPLPEGGLEVVWSKRF